MPLHVVTAGESHGPGLTTIVEGLPAGLELDQEAIDGDMARRQLGHGRGGRMKIEKDSAQVTAGVRHGRTLGVSVVSHVTQIGSITAPEYDELSLAAFADVDVSPVRCLDAAASKAMVGEINVLRKRNESIGGIFELRAFGLVPGLGSHVSWEQRLDGRIGMALLSIQAAKGVGLGDGFDLAGRPGSEAHDEIFYSSERGYFRETNRSGGLEGGMTTGEPLIARVAMKPIPTLTKPLRSVDISTHEPAQALRERTDSCVVPAAGVVGEAMLAIVLAGAYRDKFGGDHIDDVRATVDAYCRRISWKPRP